MARILLVDDDQSEPVLGHEAAIPYASVRERQPSLLPRSGRIPTTLATPIVRGFVPPER